jgi:hypothetical protein
MTGRVNRIFPVTVKTLWSKANGFAAQQTQAAVGVAVLNRILPAGHPKSFRSQAVIT